MLKKQGYQNPHIHPGGWLSGVIYLKVVPSLDKNEGAIEFSLNGQYYSNVNSPKLEVTSPSGCKSTFSLPDVNAGMVLQNFNSNI